MGGPFQRNGYHPFVEPRFRPFESGPYGDASGAEDYRGPLVPPRGDSEPAPATFGLPEPEAFIAQAAALYGGKLTPAQERGLRAITANAAGIPTPDLAYVLATADHESGNFQWMHELGKGRGYPYGRPGRNGGQIPYGRGYVQITGDDNYELYDRRLGLNGALVADYDLATDPDIAARILVTGMTADGGFTGAGGTRRYFGDHELADEGLFRSARRIVNGPKEKPEVADKIARRAMEYQALLSSLGYRPRPPEVD